MSNLTFNGRKVSQEDYDRLMYMSEPGKLALSSFRPKLNFTINKGMGGFNISDLKRDYDIDYDVYLPTKGKNLQRGFVWSLEQKRELILSVMKGVKLPPVTVIQYTNDLTGRREKRILKVIDGKQRISTLIDFIENKFSILFNNKEYYYTDLTKQSQREIDDCIRFDIGYEYPDTLISDDEKIAWFEMINFAGTPQDAEHLKNLKS
jgi:uncharacterized protein with ParB-like and HNH nuclease domain